MGATTSTGRQTRAMPKALRRRQDPARAARHTRTDTRGAQGGMGEQRTQDAGGREEHARGHRAPRAPGTPTLPWQLWGDTDRGGIATNVVVHTLQTHEDKGATTPTETKFSGMRSCSGGEGMRAAAGRSVLSWQEPAAAQSAPVMVHGPPRTTGKRPLHPGPRSHR